MVINDFYYEKISKEDARNLLDGILTEEMKPYDENARILIEKIYEADKIPATEEIVEVFEEETNIDTVPEESVAVEPIEAPVEILAPQDDMLVEKEQPEIDYYDHSYEYPQECEETY